MKARRALTPRKVKFDPSPTMARRWFGGDGFRSHWLNAYTILVPDGEKFIHRTVEHFVDKISDPELRAQIDDFSRQELGHAGQHTRSHRILDRQGYRYKLLLRAFSWLTYSFLERIITKKFALSVAAGVEHFNSMLAEVGLERDDYFEGADPEMARLMRWHHAEEIEHKAVVHEVLEDVAPGYLRRVVGGLVAFVLFAEDMLVMSAWLALQDGSLLRPSSWRSFLSYGFFKEKFMFRMLRYGLDYLRPSFHPANHDNYELVDRVETGDPAPIRAVG